MDLTITLGYKFNQATKKAYNISSHRDLNGWFNYATNHVYINMLSKEIKYVKSEDKIIKFFSEVTQHETLHKAIFDITGKIANDKEEKIILDFTGQ